MRKFLFEIMWILMYLLISLNIVWFFKFSGFSQVASFDRDRFWKKFLLSGSVLVVYLLAIVFTPLIIYWYYGVKIYWPVPRSQSSLAGEWLMLFLLISGGSFLYLGGRGKLKIRLVVGAIVALSYCVALYIWHAWFRVMPPPLAGPDFSVFFAGKIQIAVSLTLVIAALILVCIRWPKLVRWMPELWRRIKAYDWQNCWVVKGWQMAVDFGWKKIGLGLMGLLAIWGIYQLWGYFPYLWIHVIKPFFQISVIKDFFGTDKLAQVWKILWLVLGFGIWLCVVKKEHFLRRILTMAAIMGVAILSYFTCLFFLDISRADVRFNFSWRDLAVYWSDWQNIIGFVLPILFLIGAIIKRTWSFTSWSEFGRWLWPRFGWGGKAALTLALIWFLAWLCPGWWKQRAGKPGCWEMLWFQAWLIVTFWIDYKIRNWHEFLLWTAKGILFLGVPIAYLFIIKSFSQYGWGSLYFILLELYALVWIWLLKKFWQIDWFTKVAGLFV